MTYLRSKMRQFFGDEDGAALVEFAIVAPAFILMIFAAFDFGHAVYARAVLQGAAQDAGRDAGLESGELNKDKIDAYVRSQVLHIMPKGAVLTSRQNYQNFSDVGKPEDFVDANNNDLYDEGECFTDINENGTWDEDRAAEGLGGADDVVLYTATLTYDRIVPFWQYLGGSEKMSFSASTTLRNQPFGDQASRPEVQVCPE